MKRIKNIKNILFDLDGVLYSDLEAVFGQVSKRMTEYISNKLNLDTKKAKELQTNYFHKYNTSLNGLMINHNIFCYLNPILCSLKFLKNKLAKHLVRTCLDF